MRGWSVCLVGLYVGLQLFNWVTGLHWLTDFSLPLSILGGLGLAIASTPSSAAIKATLDPSANATTPKASETTAQAQTPTAATPESSISFTIHKNVRP